MEKRISAEIENELKLIYIIKSNKVILIESRPYYEDSTKCTERPVAQFEYKETTKGWSLIGQNRDSTTLLYIKGHLEELIQELDKDHTGVFWGKPAHRTCHRKSQYNAACN